MNKISLVFLGILSLLLVAAIPAMAASPQTVSTTWTGDINFNDVNINGTLSAGQSFLAKYYLPCTLQQIKNTGDANLTIKAGADPIDIIITINGVQVYSGTFSAGATGYSNITLWNSSGVNMSDTYIDINVTVTANSTAWTNLTVTANDAVLSGSNFSSSATEAFLTTPTVGYGEDNSVVTVKDTLTASQTSDFNITNATVAITYPSHAISQADTSKNLGNLNTGSSVSTSVSYQKKGPYVASAVVSASGTKKTVKMDLYSPDNYTAKMDFYASEKPWSKHFPSFNKNTLEVKLDDSSVTWKDPSGHVIIDSMSLTKGWHNMTFTYTVALPPVVVTQEKLTWYDQLMQSYYGLPLWAWILIAVYVVIAVVYVKRR